MSDTSPRDTTRPKPTHVYFFSTCVVDLMAPQAGVDAIALIQAAGIEVDFPPDQSCCGQPAYTSGYTDEARRVARAQLDLFPQPWPIVVPSGSCAGMMVHQWPQLFADDARLAATARQVARRVVEFSAFARDVLGLAEPAPPRQGAAGEGGAAHLAARRGARWAPTCRAKRCCAPCPASSWWSRPAWPSAAASAAPSRRGTRRSRAPWSTTSSTAVRDSGAEVLVSADCGCLLNLHHARRQAPRRGRAAAALRAPGQLRARTPGCRPTRRGRSPIDTPTRGRSPCPCPTPDAARSAILGALRAGAPAPPLPPPDLQPYLDGPLRPRQPGAARRPATLVAPFETAARSWRADVLHAGAPTGRRRCAQALDQRGCRRIAIGAASPLQPALDAALAGLQVRRFEQPLEQWKGELFDAVDASVTAAAGGIADTGTLVLRPGADEPRTLSLVPAVHVAVLQASRLHASLPAALRALAPPGDLPSNLLLSAGPSKTADIQQVLAYGAHGPKELVIVLVHDLPPAEGSTVMSAAPAPPAP